MTIDEADAEAMHAELIDNEERTVRTGRCASRSPMTHVITVASEMLPDHANPGRFA